MGVLEIVMRIRKLAGKGFQDGSARVVRPAHEGSTGTFGDINTSLVAERDGEMAGFLVDSRRRRIRTARTSTSWGSARVRAEAAWRAGSTRRFSTGPGPRAAAWCGR
jgi:hypothetical protein